MVHMTGAEVLFVIAIEGNALKLLLFDLHEVTLRTALSKCFR